LKKQSEMNFMKTRFIRQIIFYGILLAIWEGLALAKVWPEYIFPSPLDVLRSLAEGFKDSTFLVAIVISLRRIAVGYGISVILGGLMGLAISRFSIVKDTVGNLSLGLQTLPSICWLPLALLWFGINEKAIYFVVIMGATFSITMATHAGVRNVQPIFIKAGRNMGARRMTLFREVIIPAAMPSILSGLKQGWSFAWRSLMAGELLFVNLGLGHLLMMGRELNDMSRVIAVMIVIAVISILTDKFIFGAAESHLQRKWGLDCTGICH